MKNQVIFGMGILHVAYGLKVLRQAKNQYAPDVPRGHFWLRHFQNLWDNGAKTQPRQNTDTELPISASGVQKIQLLNLLLLLGLGTTSFHNHMSWCIIVIQYITSKILILTTGTCSSISLIHHFSFYII